MSRPQPPLAVLIVEDEALLAMDVAMIVEDAGHRVVAEAASLDEVKSILGSTPPHLVLLDIQLAKGQSGFDVCRLVRGAWPDTIVVFLTANPKQLPPDYCGGHGFISKPFSRNGLCSALKYVEEGICNPPPKAAPPASFVGSNAFAATWS